MASQLYEEDTYLIRGICMEVHRILGHGFSEIMYKDALAHDFKRNNIQYKRETKYKNYYGDIILPHFFFADFLIMEKIILEVKAKENIAKEDVSQAINYLKASGCKLALIVNFGKDGLVIKRIVLQQQVREIRCH